ncbi:protein C14orf124 family protein [Acanthamoeba castellanii str. Neff]|uniref:Protein C14orf124 family protein n=1 Tax=Acanthamoeba castellanii (strain ATCC 30010 / Neff) TaxID=1257118 RepID=L8GSD8_ACACF|nr:protein C14orf124 family protein [Acanthamoeba castellanii str. Neff]ELR15036.1 protein C14orf124 family protein [Acanthamoeba castellanii str. Neff]
MKKSTGEGLRVLVGGGSGFIGSALTRHLASRGHSLRLISRTGASGGLSWEEVDKAGLPPCDAVINLAGANLMGKLLWTQAYRQEVWDSRINTNKAIARAIGKMNEAERPKVFVSASAVDEDHAPRADSWFGELTEAWEGAADEAADATRVVKVRTGIVLGRDGGALASMLPSFQFGMGNVMGDGRQYFPWVHLDDIVGLYEHAVVNDNVTGVVNGVAPDAKNAQEFAECLAKTMGTSVKFHLPAFVIETMFGSERAKLLLEGHKVIPKRTLASGYQFKHPQLEEALADVLKKK